MSTLPPLVLLSAGRSSRLGQPKGLYPVGDATWLEAQLSSLQAVGVREVVVVLGHASAEYFQRLPWLEAAHSVPSANMPIPAACSVRINPAPERGMFSSLQIGLGGCREHSDVFVMPIDTPCPRQDVWQALASVGSPAQAVMPRFAGRGGHPVLLRQPLLERLLALDPLADDAQLDRQIQGLDPAAVAHVACDDIAVTQNLNTPADFVAFICSR